MTLSLYQITNDLREMLDDAFDPETGEALPAFQEKREMWSAKAYGVVAYIGNLEVDIVGCELARERVTHLLKAKKKKLEALTSYLASNMKECGITEIKGPGIEAKLYVDRDVSVEILDEKQLPMSYTREVPAQYPPDKNLIKKALDDGFDVPGAKLSKKDRLTIK